jgi:nitrogen fixation protein
VSPTATTCPRCGATVESLQEYCLECGLRVRGGGVVPALASGWRRRLHWYPGDWVWPSLLALVVAVIASAGAIWWTREASSAASTTVIGDTAPLPTVPTTARVPTTGPAATVPTQTRQTTTAPRRPPARRALIEWPQGRNGWTLVLVSLPTSAGRPQAVGRAREAVRAGLDDVGVIDSSEYASLHPGYYVVFSGVYPTIAAAQDAVSDAAEAGFENAYARRVTS